MFERKRREFITLLAGAAAWPLAARAQQPMRRIGVLTPFAADNAEGDARLSAFTQGLDQSGWIVGQNIQIDYRRGDGKAATMRKLAAELVARAGGHTSLFQRCPRAAAGGHSNHPDCVRRCR